jgi:hypothetical protein
MFHPVGGAAVSLIRFCGQASWGFDMAHFRFGNPLWCPGLDTEMTDRAKAFIEYLPDMYHTPFEYGGGGLREFRPTEKLYILAHGHAQVPLFVTEKGSWSAAQIAEMLLKDGLSKEWRDIELLVCHAGESVNTKTAGDKLLAIRTQAKAAEAIGKTGRVAQLKAKFEAFARAHNKQRFFESDPERLLVPLAAQLAMALRSLKFTHFRIISYKCPVAQYRGGPHVYLDLTLKGGDWGVSADSPKGRAYRVVWR